MEDSVATPSPDMSVQITPLSRATLSSTVIAPIDCKRIAFVLFNFVDFKNPDIYTACPDGSTLQQLTFDPSSDTDPVWSPDGERIAFTSERTGDNQIFVMDADGQSLLQLTFDYKNDLPVWLPHGGHIAFRTSDGQGLWWWRILDIASGEISDFTEPSFDFFYQTPAWSPDGQFIAYMSLLAQKERNDGASQIHVRAVNGSSDVALTNDTWANVKPIWSPDGEKIAFLSERDGNYHIFALYVMDSDGKNVQRLTEPSYTEMASFTWSLDGSQIAIGDIAFGHIYIFDLDTGNKREFLALQNGEAVLAPSWQP
ncbi:MAG: hypothetical protein HND51_16680 [Chloroflexi bacterium]|nr:hypothetical protein [Chloroflexota bacterium]